MAKDKGDFNSVLFRNIADAAEEGSGLLEITEMFPELQKLPYGSKARRDFMDAISPEDKAEAYRRAEAKANSRGDSIAVFDPDYIRSPNAAFDPQYSGPNIMGNATVPMLGATAAGAAALAPALTDFGPTAVDKLDMALAESARNQQHGTIDAPHNAAAFDATMALRGAERAVQGSPASLLFPEGSVDYVETINDRQRDPNWWQRAGFLFDWLPI